MFKQILLTGLIIIVTSCSQNKQPKIGESSSDSITRSEKRDTAEVNAKPAVVDLNANLNPNSDDIKNLPPSLAQFIPVNYNALDTTSGDLNLDQYSDMIMVLRKNGEDTTSDVVEHPEKRPLLILLGQADNTYKLAARSDNAVYCVDCGGMMGDPFMEVVIKKGYFSIEHYGGSGWRWTRTITFKYAPADNYWYLHKDGGESFHAADPEKIKTKVKTVKDFGKVPFDSFDIYKEN
jgi:hypothetical protein